MILANFFATLITNPFDVVLSKMSTQQKQYGDPNVKGGWKYTNLVQALRTVLKEEGARKLWLGGLHPRFMFNMVNATMFLFIYDRFMV